MLNQQSDNQAVDNVAEVAQSVLREMERVLAASIDYETPLQNVARLLVPAVADWCVIDLLQGNRLLPVAAMHIEPDKVEQIHELRRRFPVKVSDRIGAPNVIRTGKPELYDILTDRQLEQVAQDEQHLQILRSLGLGSGVVVPLTAWDRQLGAMTLISQQPSYYSTSDLPLIEELGRRCALVAHSARACRDAQQGLGEHRKAQEAMREGERHVQLLEVRAAQQAAVARFGQEALAESDLQALFERAVQIISRTLGNEMCKVLRLLPNGEAFELMAGVGWRDGLVGVARVPASLDSQAGYTVVSDQPVVVKDLRQETRFSGPALLHEHGVVSGMSVIIAGEHDRPWGVLGTHTRQRRDYSPDDVNFLQALANIVATAIHRKTAEQRVQALNETLEQRVAQRTAEVRQRAAQLQAMAAQLSQVEQRERRRLAEILHDDLQQLLAASKLQLDMLCSRATDSDLQADLRMVKDLLGRSIELSRNLTVELSPPILYEAGLVSALQWLARWMQEKYKMVVHLAIEQQVDLENEDLRILTFQSVRELLFNTMKYAGVTEAHVQLKQPDGAHLQIIVADRGKGFDMEQAQQQQHEGGGFGLFSIRQRLEVMGGEMEIWSQPGQGTTTTLLVPFRRRLPGSHTTSMGTRISDE